MNAGTGRMTAALLCAAIASGAQAQRSSTCEIWYDPADDAMIRPTDPGADGAINPLGVLPEIESVQLCGWRAFSPATDPYSGETTDASHAHLFRLMVTFAGLVNPPGPLGLDGEPFLPFMFGSSPVVGFLDIDVDGRDAQPDDDEDTGGELGAAAEGRYLANVARFGRIPDAWYKERVAVSRADLDDNFYTDPQFERTGEDFALVFCGCFTPTAEEVTGDGNALFEAGETWLVRGRFFERAQGYRDASAAYGGSAPGLYDPVVELRFSHSIVTDETTVTLVWALDQTGAAELAGQPEQGMDFNVANQASVAEALRDIIMGADDGGISGPAWVLVRHWQDKDPTDWLDVTKWEVTGLFGMPYAVPEATNYVWTDTLGSEIWGDMDGDLEADEKDQALIRAFVYAHDGTDDDDDGEVNGIIKVAVPGWDFLLEDTNGDGVVSYLDLAPCGPLGDFNRNGVVNTQDFVAFLNAWANGQVSADFDLNQHVNTQDFIAFLNAWAQG